MIYVPFRFLLLKRFKKMKRFKLLSALFVWLIWLVSFWYCEYVTTTSLSITFQKWQHNFPFWTYDCLFFVNVPSSVTIYSSTWYNLWTLAKNSVVCNIYDTPYYNAPSASAYTAYWFNLWIEECEECQTCEDQYTSQECQQEYSLMPISSCNSEYCWLNWLCPEYTWSTMSELYINWINHLWAPIINLTFPLEQSWDYNYTWDVMNINLSWENNVDYEYMDNIIRTQHSTPNNTDFNNTISWLIPLFIPWLVIILFIIFVFRFLKKIF